ncbi:IclR family transcriptional regulator [Planktotalea sp.]|uniref:IclR family transcriptional regulator n=1 Tax=Planktotalea sp. TaxID=2029877 RepID=UPI003D6A5047
MMDDLRSDGGDKDRNFVTALARGLELLRCFRDGEVTLTNSDFSERTGLPKATISRLTHTLCALDYLVSDPRSGTYRLSAGVLHLGFSVLASLDIQDLLHQEMKRIHQGPNLHLTVSLAEQHQLDAVYVAHLRSHEPVALVGQIGSRLPLFTTSVGLAILVGKDDDAREAVFEIAGRVSKETELEGRRRYADAKSVYEVKGFCTGYGQWRRDVNAIAVPIHSLNRLKVYGLNVGGPSFQVKPKQLESVYGPKLIQAADSLRSNTLN